MVIVGLTGSMGTGKSTVASMFDSLGAKVIDADKIAHRLLWRNSPCFGAICRTFGKDILQKGRIKRQKLAEVVFGNKTKLRRLEKIIHPQVIKEMKKRLARCRKTKSHKVVVLDVPLLFEAGMDKMTDINITVVCNRITQVKRLLRKGGIKREGIVQRIRRQIPLNRKKRESDFTISNNSNLRSTKAQVVKIWNILYL